MSLLQDTSVEVNFTQRTSELLSSEMFLADSMALKIRVHLSLNDLVRRVVMHLKPEDKWVFAKDTHTLDITLSEVEGTS